MFTVTHTDSEEVEKLFELVEKYRIGDKIRWCYVAKEMKGRTGSSTRCGASHPCRPSVPIQVQNDGNEVITVIPFVLLYHQCTTTSCTTLDRLSFIPDLGFVCDFSVSNSGVNLGEFSLKSLLVLLLLWLVFAGSECESSETHSNLKK